MNILGIDFGTKRIGMAWMQEELDVVLPFGVIHETDRKKNMEAVVKVIQDERIDKIVVGLPFGLDGGETENTKRVREFARELGEKIKLPVEFEGEEFTTKEATQMEGDASLDEKAAMLILEGYRGKND